MQQFYVWVKVESTRKYTVEAGSHEEAMTLGQAGQDADGNAFTYTEEVESSEALDSLEAENG